MFDFFLISLLVSLVVTVLVVHLERFHSFTHDHDLDGPQKFHVKPVPRIGGLPIMAGWLTGLAFLAYKAPSPEYWLLPLASLPAWGAGILEDVTKKVGVTARLLATFVAAIIGYWLLGAYMPRLDVPGIDYFYQASLLIPLAFTLFTVGGVAHAMNIVDGYNGLTGMLGLLYFAAMGYVAFQVGDTAILAICLCAAGATLGFLVWNYPSGLIFAGDGGAYLLGFLIAEISTLLVVRHPEVSPWFPLLLVIYPVFETLFTMYRRKFMQGKPVGYPDALHLHQMIYRRLVRWMVGSNEAKHRTQRNSLTSPYLWAVALLSVTPAVLFWNRPGILALCVFAFVFIYLWLYNRLVRFRAPRMLMLRRRYTRPLKPNVNEQSL